MKVTINTKTQKQEKQKQPKKRKETFPTDTVRPAKKKKTVEITETSFI